MSTPRIKRYVPVIQEFAARIVLLHDAVARLLGLNATDVKALRLLGTGAMTASRLAEFTGLTGAAVTALVDRLEAAGFVTRARALDDRRRVIVRAVPRKLRELDRLYAGLQARMSKALAALSTAEFEAVLRYLRGTAEILAQETVRLRRR
jgi:DNA-binding MarR family transcriptional regulator